MLTQDLSLIRMSRLPIRIKLTLVFDDQDPHDGESTRHHPPLMLWCQAPDTPVAGLDQPSDGRVSLARGVLHEVALPMVHVDVRLVPPNDDFPFHRLVTSGTAEVPMTVPPGFPYTPFAELTIALPRDWPTESQTS